MKRLINVVNLSKNDQEKKFKKQIANIRNDRGDMTIVHIEI